PAATASRTAFSISRCEVMPTFLRKPRRLLLKLSSFMMCSISAHDLDRKTGTHFSGSCDLGSHRIVQHLLGEITLDAIGAGIGVAALDIAVLAAIDVVLRADCTAGAAVDVV